MAKKSITRGSKAKAVIPTDRIEGSIIVLRGHKVLLDRDLAKLYQVETRTLNQAVTRNIQRFPSDFMFQLNPEEFANLKSQIATSSSGWGGTRKAPRAFTEQGVAMLSSVLKSERAIQVNIEIMRAFVRMRKMLTDHAELARKIENLEKKYDKQFMVVFQAIRQLMEPPSTTSSKEPFGFHPKKKK